MKALARIFVYDGYEVVDVRVSVRDRSVVFVLEHAAVNTPRCHRCDTPLASLRARHPLRLKELSIMGFETTVRCWRRKGHCATCGKIRSEQVSFVARESPHMTQRFAWSLGALCEFAAVSRAAEFVGVDAMTARRVDYERMRRMLRRYKIPAVKRISVDEVYARRKPRATDQSRDDRFFTVITDLDTRRVIWVAESRRREALDQFFALLGPDACRQIRVCAMDQHEGYRAAVKKHCPQAAVVLDKFHLLQSFGEAVNETRKEIFEHLAPKDEAKRLCRGKYRFVFLKLARHRTKGEQEHIDDAMLSNGFLYRLELIKEKMRTVFDERTAAGAWKVFRTVGEWIREARFPSLERWWRNLEADWEHVASYFSHRVTSAVSEGLNNVIKALKRRAYGYRDMDYFRLKIMQVCGYLNSRFIKTFDDLASD